MGQRLESLIWIIHPDGRRELDFGWAILIVCCLVGCTTFMLTAAGVMTPGPSVAAWAWFGSFTTFSFIAGTAISRARLIAESKAAGEVVKAIASSPVQPNLLTDDERGDAE